MATEDMATKRLLQILEADDALQLKLHIQQGHWDPKGFFLKEECFPLRWAAAFSKLECLSVLLQHQEQQPESAEWSLIEAVQEGQEPVVRIMIDEGVPAEGLAGQYTHDTDDDSPISAALALCNPKILEILCEAGGIQRSEVEWLNHGLENLLASRKKQRDKCLLLFSEEIVRRMAREPEFALEPALSKKIVERLKRLATKAEDPEPILRYEATIRDRFEAAEAIKQELIDFLTSSDADHSTPRKVERRLEEMEGLARKDITNAVLPFLTRRASDYGVETWWELVYRCVDHWEAEIDTRGNYGRTSLAIACMNTAEEVSIEAIRFFLDRRADPNALDVDGRSPLALHLGTGDASSDLVSLLRAYGAKTYGELGMAYPKYAEQDFLDYGEMPPLGELSTHA